MEDHFFPFPVWWVLLVPGSSSFFGDMKISLSFYRVSMVRQLLENCPELNLMLHDPEVMKQVGPPQKPRASKNLRKFSRYLISKNLIEFNMFSRVIGKKPSNKINKQKKTTMDIPLRVSQGYPDISRGIHGSKFDAPSQKKILRLLRNLWN